MTNDFYIIRSQAPKTGMYPLIKGAYQKAASSAKSKGVTPYAAALKYVDTAPVKRANLMYLKNRNVDLGSNVNAIELAILAHAERLKDLAAKIPDYKATAPELFQGADNTKMLKDIVRVENDLERQEVPNTMHWGMLKPAILAANNVIYDANFDASNATDLLLPEIREIVKNKAADTADKFNNFDWGGALDTVIKGGANIVAPGAGTALDKTGFSVKGLTGGSKKAQNRQVILLDKYWPQGSKFNQPVVLEPATEDFYQKYKKQIEGESGGIPFERVMDDFQTVDKYNRPYLSNGRRGADYYKSINDEATRLKLANIGRAEPVNVTTVMPTGGQTGGPNLPEIGGVKWGKGGVSWDLGNNKSQMIYLAMGGLILIVVLFLIMRKK